MAAALPPLSGDAPILDRIGRGLPAIADRMLAAGLGSTPPIADLPDGHFREVVPAILDCGRGFLRALREQREFSDAELARYVAPVVRRHAEERIPLRLLIDAVHGSAQQLLLESARSAAPEELDDLVTFGAHLLDLLRRINLVVYEGYSEVEQSVFQPDREPGVRCVRLCCRDFRSRSRPRAPTSRWTSTIACSRCGYRPSSTRRRWRR
ncbi:hypothetical protein [Nocardia cyriacigeorgica]|uniref:hypothetical protein n=1 Tax=Nocardia cyriacigeorgica TaxID=135487 RepID=UPI0024575954|nr:hypothetical protein [Nocardia cyriacigeorgica]